MNKNIVMIGLISFLLTSVTVFSATAIDTVTFTGNTLYVGGTGPRNYTYIQDAIDNASENDTIYVYNGTYYERLEIFSVDNISLIGEEKETTIIDGGGEGNVVTIYADNVTVSGFTIQNSDEKIDYDIDEKGIKLHSNYCLLKDNVIKGFSTGIVLEKSNNNTITNNYISNNYDGISLSRSNYNTISDNTIILSLCSNIRLFYSTYNILNNNTIKLSGSGIDLGGTIKQSSKNTGMKDGKQLYRVTHLLRLPSYKKDDFIFFNKKYYKILRVTANKLKLINLKTWEETKVDMKEMEKSKIVLPDSIKEMIIINQDDDEIQVMDEKTYKIKILKKPKSVNFKSDKIMIISIDDNIFAYPINT